MTSLTKAVSGRMCSPCSFLIVTVDRRGSAVMASASAARRTGAASSRRGTVGAIDQVPDFVTGPGRPQRADKTVIPQAARDILQRPQVVARTILRRDEQHEHVYRFAVQAIERHAP